MMPLGLNAYHTKLSTLALGRSSRRSGIRDDCEVHSHVWRRWGANAEAQPDSIRQFQLFIAHWGAHWRVNTFESTVSTADATSRCVSQRENRVEIVS